mgnify:FL=1
MLQIVVTDAILHNTIEETFKIKPLHLAFVGNALATTC